MGPVAVQADLVVPPVSFVGACVCGYRAVFFHFIDEYFFREDTHDTAAHISAHTHMSWRSWVSHTPEMVTDSIMIGWIGLSSLVGTFEIWTHRS